MNAIGFWKKTNWLYRILIVIYVLSFSGATYNHVSDLVRGGFLPYQNFDANVPGWLNVYWTLLTFFDPIAIVVLIANVGFGAWLFLAIIVSDVIINVSYLTMNYGLERCLNFFTICQALFMVFAGVTIAPILLEVKRIKSKE